MEYKISKLSNDQNLDIHIIEIKNSNNYKIKFFTYGGYMHEVHIPSYSDPSQQEDVLLGYGSLKDIIDADGYFNSIIGRVCNRIGKSRFTLNNKEYQLYPNTQPDHLHGGKEGFNKKIWNLDNIKKEGNYVKCTLNYLSSHLEENYPGNLHCKTTYELNDNNEIIIIFEAFTDRDTIVNLTNHNYWNFHGHKDFYQNISDHYVRIDSNFICENDENSIPTGKILNVNNTKYDLTKHYLIQDSFLHAGGIDNNYSLVDNKNKRPVAQIYSNKTGMGVEYSTNQKGIQFYTGNMMNEKYNGKYNKHYGVQYGICLETQNFPDAINHSNFPSPILKVGETYKSFTKIKLRNDFKKLNHED